MNKREFNKIEWTFMKKVGKFNSEVANTLEIYIDELNYWINNAKMSKQVNHKPIFMKKCEYLNIPAEIVKKEYIFNEINKDLFEQAGIAYTIAVFDKYGTEIYRTVEIVFDK